MSRLRWTIIAMAVAAIPFLGRTGSSPRDESGVIEVTPHADKRPTPHRSHGSRPPTEATIVAPSPASGRASELSARRHARPGAAITASAQGNDGGWRQAARDFAENPSDEDNLTRFARNFLPALESLPSPKDLAKTDHGSLRRAMDFLRKVQAADGISPRLAETLALAEHALGHDAKAASLLSPFDEGTLSSEALGLLAQLRCRAGQWQAGHAAWQAAEDRQREEIMGFDPDGLTEAAEDSSREFYEAARQRCRPA